MTTPSTTTNDLSPRLSKALGRVVSIAARDAEAELRERAAQLKAVKDGFGVYLTRAPLAERRALLEAIAQMVGARPAARIRAYAEAMQEWTPPAPAGAVPVEAVTVEATAKPTKGDEKAG